MSSARGTLPEHATTSIACAASIARRASCRSPPRRLRKPRDGGAITPIAGTPTRPNGIALSLDERTLFVTGTDGLRRFDLAVDGSIVAGPFDVAAVTGGLDGLGLDCAGNLYVTGNDRVTVLDPTLTRIGELAATGATNVAFGSADGRTIFVTYLGTPPGLRSAHLNVPGLPY